MTFRPFPGLTIFTLIALGILLWLGTWQYGRMGEKSLLLSRIDTAASSAPFSDFSGIIAARNAGEPIDFRRARLKLSYVSSVDGTPGEYHVYKSQDGKTAWRIFREAKTGSGANVFVAADIVADGAKSLPRPVSSDPVYIAGYVRTWQRPSRFAAKSTPSANRWFSFNALKDTAPWTSAAPGTPVEQDLYIDAAQISDAPISDELPVKKPDIPNNHFDYMLTWYSFALILLIIYFILHIRGGRLRFK